MNRFRVNLIAASAVAFARFGRHCARPHGRLRPEGTGQLSLLRARRRLDELLFRFLGRLRRRGSRPLR